jgi:BCD family chlorophyll transporter-like MFS transporter
VTLLALWGLEGRPAAGPTAETSGLPAEAGSLARMRHFGAALKAVAAEPEAWRFTVFVLVSMVAYSAQDLILEPFAGLVFGFTPGQTTQLAGVQHGGTLLGMLLAAFAGRRVAGAALGSLRAWTAGGCIASAIAMMGLVVAASGAVPGWPLRANVFVMGVANGAFSIAAIGAMMALAGGRDGAGGEGTRLGLWGAAQALGFAAGGTIGAAASDALRWLSGSPVVGYGGVFAVEALMFLAAAALAWRLGSLAPRATDPHPGNGGRWLHRPPAEPDSPGHWAEASR